MAHANEGALRRHCTDGLAALTALPAGSVDLIFSQAALEHVRRAEFARLWREMLSGVVTQVAGDYDYVARWADGGARRGTLDVSELETASIVLTEP